jgi:phosphotransferase system  glucose/maltose/N-acetylglucosamine-specific IIC component
LTVTYEDEKGNAKTLSKEFSMTVEEMQMGGAIRWAAVWTLWSRWSRAHRRAVWVWIVVGVGVVAAVVVVLVVLKKKKAKRRAAQLMEDDDEDI